MKIVKYCDLVKCESNSLMKEYFQSCMFGIDKCIYINTLIDDFRGCVMRVVFHINSIKDDLSSKTFNELNIYNIINLFNVCYRLKKRDISIYLNIRYDYISRLLTRINTINDFICFVSTYCLKDYYGELYINCCNVLDYLVNSINLDKIETMLNDISRVNNKIFDNYKELFINYETKN